MSVLWWQVLNAALFFVLSGVLCQLSYRQGRRHEREKWERDRKWYEIDRAITQHRWADVLRMQKEL